MKTNDPITVAITGASGAQYGLRLVEVLLQLDIPVYLLVSKAALMVMAVEMDLKIPSNHAQAILMLEAKFGVPSGLLKMFSREDWMSPVASGSGAPKKMVVCPCSTGTLSAIAHGASDNLIERAADVVLKERNQLILLVREMPLSTIHLKNMVQLSEMGVSIMPASPGFYNRPQSVEQMIDFVVARILSQLDIESDLNKPWGQS